jgi:hypothetical protein
MGTSRLFCSLGVPITTYPDIIIEIVGKARPAAQHACRMDSGYLFMPEFKMDTRTATVMKFSKFLT